MRPRLLFIHASAQPRLRQRSGCCAVRVRGVPVRHYRVRHRAAAARINLVFHLVRLGAFARF